MGKSQILLYQVLQFRESLWWGIFTVILLLDTSQHGLHDAIFLMEMVGVLTHPDHVLVIVNVIEKLVGRMKSLWQCLGRFSIFFW